MQNPLCVRPFIRHLHDPPYKQTFSWYLVIPIKSIIFGENDDWPDIGFVGNSCKWTG